MLSRNNRTHCDCCNKQISRTARVRLIYELQDSFGGKMKTIAHYCPKCYSRHIEKKLKALNS